MSDKCDGIKFDITQGVEHEHEQEHSWAIHSLVRLTEKQAREVWAMAPGRSEHTDGLDWLHPLWDCLFNASGPFCLACDVNWSDHEAESSA